MFMCFAGLWIKHMKQQETAEKIIHEIKSQGLVPEEHLDKIEYYLLLAYAAGFDRARFQSTYHKPVAQISLQGETLYVHDSAAVASRKTGVQHSDISKCARGRLKTAGGYRWRYVLEMEITDGVAKTIGSLIRQSDLPKPGNRVHLFVHFQ